MIKALGGLYLSVVLVCVGILVVGVVKGCVRYLGASFRVWGNDNWV